jgi:glycosyltransferase involved in cell wall biosynthesis
MTLPHITVCICTYQRPALLSKLLRALELQQTRDQFTYSAVVCDNDGARAAQVLVEIFAVTSSLAVVYCVEPRRNIALARNRAIEHACGEFIAFIDDDEFPVPDWLHHLFATCRKTGAAGVLGPVRPHFETAPPQWVIDGKFCERPEHPTGTVVPWPESRTGNVLFNREILRGAREAFHAKFGNGGEDVDFFRRMALQGEVFVWCNEAVAHEAVPPSRWTRRFMLKRALLRGRNHLKVGHATVKDLLKSFVAVPIYSLVLLAAPAFGPHVTMKYGIKFCDHLGRVLALIGINPVHERPV